MSKDKATNKLEKTDKIFIFFGVLIFLCVAIYGVFFIIQSNPDTMVHYVFIKLVREDPSLFFQKFNRIMDLARTEGSAWRYPPMFHLLHLPFVGNMDVIQFLMIIGTFSALFFYDKKAAILLLLSGVFLFNFLMDFSDFYIVFFILLGLLAVRKKKYYLGGILISLSYYVKETASFCIVGYLIYLFLFKDKKLFFKIGIVMFLVLLPLLVKNFIVLGDPLYPYLGLSGGPIGVRETIAEYRERVAYYFIPGQQYSFIQFDILYYLGLVSMLFYRKKKSYVFVLGVVLVSIWLLSHFTRTITVLSTFPMRYFLMLFPLFAIYISDFVDRFDSKRKSIIFKIIILLIIVNCFYSIYRVKSMSFSENTVMLYEWVRDNISDDVEINAWHGWGADWYSGHNFNDNATSGFNDFTIEGIGLFFGFYTENRIYFFDADRNIQMIEHDSPIYKIMGDING